MTTVRNETEAADRYELFVCGDGRLELRDRDRPDRWISTDSPVEIER